MQTLTRNTVSTVKIANFCASLLVDLATGNWEKNMPRRAEEARETVQSMGPAYIKMGQVRDPRPD